MIKTTVGKGTKYYNGNNVVGGVVIDTAVLDRITTEMRPKASLIIQKHGLHMAGEATMNAPVGETGNLKNSIIPNSGMVKQLTFAIQDGVEYGIFQELGTSRMAAQPFVIPAIEKNVSSFLADFASLFK